ILAHVCCGLDWVLLPVRHARRGPRLLPTRRSSDLEKPVMAGRHPLAVFRSRPTLLMVRSALRTKSERPMRSGYRRFAAATGRRRSEEHTSELQSRFDIVGRLLLEEKKHTCKIESRK